MNREECYCEINTAERRIEFSTKCISPFISSLAGSVFLEGAGHFATPCTTQPIILTHCRNRPHNSQNITDRRNSSHDWSCDIEQMTSGTTVRYLTAFANCT